MNSCCIVVVGHVDHGKTSLVRALTGIETDRLPEEKARGLSITPGFAHRNTPTSVLDFIDAPGHEDFIQAMVAGASGAQAALVVISATDSICAQTREHLAILEILGITQGVIAVTKSDLLHSEDHEARLADLQNAMSAIAMAHAPMVLCSAHSGEGIEPLDAALQDLASGRDAQTADHPPMLPVDRVFSKSGHGTVVTGTLLGGDLAVGAGVVIQPQQRSATVRGLQCRGASTDLVRAGERVAVNLRGVSLEEVKRGSVISVKGAGAPTICIDVRIELQAGVAKGLRHMEAVRVLFGTAHEVASVRLFGGGGIDPTQAGFAQLRFKKPVFGYEGQRAVLRRLSPSETMGGAVFLNTQASPTRAGDKTRLEILQAVHDGSALAIATAVGRANGGACSLGDLARLARMSADAVRNDLGDDFMNLNADQVAPKSAIHTAKAEFLAALMAYHAKYPLRFMAPRGAIVLRGVCDALHAYVEAVLSQGGEIRQNDTGLAMCDHDPFDNLTADQQAELKEMEVVFKAAGIETLAASEAFDPALVDVLLGMGRIAALHNVALKQRLLLHSDTLNAAAARLNDSFPMPLEFTTSQARTALGTSRKIIVPVLEYFDKCGVTVRLGNARQMTGLIPVSLPALPC